MITNQKKTSEEIERDEKATRDAEATKNEKPVWRALEDGEPNRTLRPSASPFVGEGASARQAVPVRRSDTDVSASEALKVTSGQPSSAEDTEAGTAVDDNR